MSLKNIISSILFIGLIINFTGCALKRGEVSLNQESDKSILVDKKNESIYVETVRDNRVFEVSPKSPNIPSLSPSELDTAEIRSRAVARKRNTYGQALGDIVLKEGQTVSSVIKDNIEIAFEEMGYNVIRNDKYIDDKTIIVKVDINKFWSWMNPSFWAIRISTELTTNLDIKKNGEVNNEKIEVLSKDYFQTALGSNWIEVMQKALKQHSQKIKERISK